VNCSIASHSKALPCIVSIICTKKGNAYRHTAFYAFSRCLQSQATMNAVVGKLRNAESNRQVMRQLEIIGEAARRLSKETRLQLSESSWRQIIGMRNHLIHIYDDVDLAIVWDTIQNDLSPLIARLERVVPPE
jgi:uncharacterized protein with HEPN domain